MSIRRLIERALREVDDKWPITPKPTASRYDRAVIKPRNLALLAGLGVTGAGMLGYSLHKNRKRARK